MRWGGTSGVGMRGVRGRYTEGSSKRAASEKEGGGRAIKGAENERWVSTVTHLLPAPPLTPSPPIIIPSYTIPVNLFTPSLHPSIHPSIPPSTYPLLPYTHLE